MMRTLGRIGIKLMRIPWWSQIMMTAGTAIAGYAVSKISNRISSNRDLNTKLERIHKLRSDKIITEEEYEILHKHLVEKYGK